MNALQPVSELLSQADDRYVLKLDNPAPSARSGVRVEICRSFSFKLNLGNYQSADFFMSQKSECAEEDAEVVSEGLYQFCKRETLKAVREFQEESQRRAA